MTEAVKLQNASLFGTFSSKGYKRNIHNELLTSVEPSKSSKRKFKHRLKLLKYYYRCYGANPSCYGTPVDLFTVGKVLMPVYEEYNNNPLRINKVQRVTNQINAFTKSQLTKVFLNAGVTCQNKEPLLLKHGDDNQYILIDTGKKKGELHILDRHKNTLAIYTWIADLENSTPEKVLDSWNHVILTNPLIPRGKVIPLIFDRFTLEGVDPEDFYPHKLNLES